MLHADDPTPIHIYAGDGNISGLTVFSAKAADIVAGEDITDISFYLQNVSSSDVSLVSAGRDIVAYDVNSPLRVQAQTPGNTLFGETISTPQGDSFGAPNFGDIQIAGPGTLEVTAGRNLNLGIGPGNADGTGAGITSIGGAANPALLAFSGADIVALSGLTGGNLNFTNSSGTGFVDLFLNPSSDQSTRYLPDLGTLMGLPSSDSNQQIWDTFEQLDSKQQSLLAIKVFYLVLRDAGRDHNDPSSPNAGTFREGDAAIAALFPTGSTGGNISLTSREIKTTNGGDISLLARNGQIDVGLNNPGAQPIDQGILTVEGGNINLFADGDINVGTSRIFTLHGGNEILWSTNGNIDAGASSKTVHSAPPTRVLVFPTSGDVETDLAGLATGGGIGVLDTIVGVPPGDVDLIAPKGIVNAGDAGIRASGNLNIAAVQVLNASNISVGGKSSGVSNAPSSPSVALSRPPAPRRAPRSMRPPTWPKSRRGQSLAQGGDLPSIITVEILGYGGE